MKFAIFENTFDANGESLIFHEAIEEICVYNISKLDDAYQRISQLSQTGLFLLGYISYDISVVETSTTPLLQFIAFKNLINCKPQDLLVTLTKLQLITSLPQPQQIRNIESEINHADFFTMFDQVQDNLTQGNSYQINLTQRFKLDLADDNLFDWYYQLSRSNPVRYASFCSFENIEIISVSPELFFRKTQDKLITRPMKGTIARGNNQQELADNREKLAHDSKNLAENLIIVDLLRNDLAKIAQTNTVKVNKLFNIEEYQTVLQMTSEIEAQIPNNTSFKEIIDGIFPCGSITGAPKKRTIELIQQIEKSQRNVYTGAIGYILPNNDMLFNVAIRTLTKYAQDDFAMLGAGGGITTQSQATDELNEIYTKIKFITNFYRPDFNLVESMLVENNQISNLDQHLARLQNSAQKLLFHCDINCIQTQINQYLFNHSLDNQKQYKLRLELDNSHNLLIEHSLIEPTTPHKNIAVLELPINSKHFLFQHKTTSPITRGLYTNLYDKYLTTNIDELLFINQNNEITESRFFNPIIKLNHELLTPKLECGLLAGIYRQNLIYTQNVKETIITLEMLEQAQSIYLCNDVRGIIQCNYVGRISQ